MKKLFVCGAVVAIAALGFGAIGSAAKPATKVKTKLTIKFTPGTDPYIPDDRGAFSGRVRAKKGCARGRKIVVRSVRDGRTVARGRSNRRGRYRAPARSEITRGRYQAFAKQKTLRRGGKRIVCRAGKSRKIRVA